MHPLPEHTVTGVAYSFRKYCFPRRKSLPLSTNELRKPSTTHSNADLLIWSLYLLGGVEKWINVEALYLKAFDLAPARLSWRTKPEIPDYKKCAKALQEVEAPNQRNFLNVFSKKGPYERMLSLEGHAWCEKHKGRLSNLYSGEIVPSATGQDDERKIRRLSRSDAYRKWNPTGPDGLDLWELADAFRCTADTPWATWQGRLAEHALAAERNGQTDLLAFINAAKIHIEQEVASQ